VADVAQGCAGFAAKKAPGSEVWPRFAETLATSLPYLKTLNDEGRLSPPSIL
jgi:hypothetical protein